MSQLTIFDDRPEGRVIYLTVDGVGGVTGFNGHVDLGTGIHTALTQIVAEEMSLPMDAVRMVLGDTSQTPDQGPTIASETIQIAAKPLRQAAAQAHQTLLVRAAQRLNAPVEDVTTEGGVYRWQGTEVDLPEVMAGCDLVLRLDWEVPVKHPSLYRLVGQSTPRLDLPAKVTGQFTYIHDLTVPGMLHGHVIRPPYAGRDSGDFIGRSLLSYDEAAVAGRPGFVAVVREADFLGVVATTMEAARTIAEALPVHWRMPPPLPDMGDLAGTLKDAPSTPRVLDTQGDFAAGMAASAKQLKRRYVWPYHLHGSIGPSCAVADWADGAPIVWSGTQNPHMLRGDLARLVGLTPEALEVRRLQAAGCYGRNCADDVCGDALLMSRAVGAPVRVQLTRAQEHLWEPKGAAQLMEVEGGLDSGQSLHAYAIDSWYPSNRGPNLALLLTGRIAPAPTPSDMGDRTMIPPYRIPNRRITVHDMAPVVRAAWMRGVSALPNTFAHESFVDEMAAEAGEDPVAFRLRHMDDPRLAELVRKTAEAADWVPHEGPRLRREGRMAYGQGFAVATYVHGTWPGVAAASAAWVCDVAVDTETGDVTLTRVFVGQDQGRVINPDGVRQQIHGNVIQTASRALVEDMSFDAIAPTAKSWAEYPIQSFDRLPEIRSLLIARPEDPELGVGESAAVPAAAAIANAIFDATGVRLREAPFTPEKMRAALGLAEPVAVAPKRKWWKGALAGAVGAFSLGALALPLHQALPRVTAPAAASFSEALIEQGRQVFALGDCAVCHTADGGLANAGGRALETPFGTVYSTNLTPDPDTGLGQWSYTAFERAMRNGISRDGHQLYPAFPYTAFARINDADLYALYAYLQTLAPVRAETPRAEMLAGANLRPGMALWNAVYHRGEVLQDDPSQSPEWNRGRYLVEAAGHCSACHSPRGALGAEQTGARAYAGAMVDGWYAPPLNQMAGDRGWSLEALRAYLKTGHAPGVAAASGPMAPVVGELATLPEADLDAMAVYLASMMGVPETAVPEPVAQADLPPTATSRLFRAACGSCHEPGLADTFTAAQVSLSQSAALRAPEADAVISAIRAGVRGPLSLDLRDMPGFGGELSEAQMAALAHYLRARYAPDLPGW